MRLRRRSAVAGILAATTIIAAAPIGATAAPADPQPAAATPLTGEHPDHDYDFVDNRGGSAAPTAGQRSLVRDDNLVTRWNKLGTPASVTPAKGKLAGGLKGDAEAVARAFLKNSVGLFSLRGNACAAQPRPQDRERSASSYSATPGPCGSRHGTNARLDRHVT